MKKRETKAVQTADLLVCFPSRAHLTLLPNKLNICSPARQAESTTKRHLKRSSCGQASPLLWANNNRMGVEITEPSSPEVSCAGQIKVRHKCKSWQSVMEEMERIHNSRKHNKKKSSWFHSFGFKKDLMQFLTCLRNLSFDFRCFGSVRRSEGIISSDEDREDDENHEEAENHGGDDGNEGSRTMFSKWFMVLQENQNDAFYEEKKKKLRTYDKDECSIAEPSVPPPNALLLMRCRSAPAKSRLEERHEEEEKQEEETNNEKKERLVVMRYERDLHKISTEIAKETWVVGDPIHRSRSWRS